MGRRLRLAGLIAVGVLGCKSNGAPATSAPATPAPAEGNPAPAASVAPIGVPSRVPSPPSAAAGAPTAQEGSSAPAPSSSAAPAGSPTGGAEGALDVNRDVEPAPGALAWIAGRMIQTSKPIYFELNKGIIRRESFPVLDAVAEILRAHAGLQVEIGGHIDRPPSYGMDLSKRRARAVMEYLLSKGVDRSRLEAVGYGNTQPISHPREADGSSRNRRIEFVIRKR